MKKKQFYPTLKEACGKFRDNWKNVIIIMLIDITFFICIAGAFTGAWNNSFFHVNRVMDLMDAEMGDLADAQSQEQLQALAANYDVFMEQYNQIAKYVITFLITTVLCWMVFQGVNWHLTKTALAKKRHKFLPYIGKFTAVSAFWWLIFIFVFGFGMKMSFYSSVSTFPFLLQGVSGAVRIILMLAVFYLAYTSFALLPGYKLKESFKAVWSTARKKYELLAPSYAFMAVVLVGEYFFFLKSFIFGYYAPILFALVIIFPTIAWTRFYAIIISSKKEELE